MVEKKERKKQESEWVTYHSVSLVVESSQIASGVVGGLDGLEGQLAV